MEKMWCRIQLRNFKCGRTWEVFMASSIHTIISKTPEFCLMMQQCENNKKENRLDGFFKDVAESLNSIEHVFT